MYDLGGRHPETLPRLSKTGAKVWTVSVPSAFPPDTTSDHGWNVEHDTKAKVDLVTLGGPEQQGVLDLSQWDPLVGIDHESGRVLWRSTGASLDCDDRLTDSDHGRPVPLRCRYTGTATYQPSEILNAKDVVLEGFDTRTGATTWPVDAGSYRGLFPTAKAGPVPHLAAHQILLDTAPGGSAALDLVSGKTTNARSGLVATCRSKALYLRPALLRQRQADLGPHRRGAAPNLARPRARCHPGTCCATPARPSAAPRSSPRPPH